MPKGGNQNVVNTNQVNTNQVNTLDHTIQQNYIPNKTSPNKTSPNKTSPNKAPPNPSSVTQHYKNNSSELTTQSNTSIFDSITNMDSSTKVIVLVIVLLI